MTVLLDEMTAAELMQLAADEIKGLASPEAAEWLRGPGRARWRDALVELMTSTNAEFTGRRADLMDAIGRLEGSNRERRQAEAELRTDYDDWRRNASRFKQGVEARLREAKRGDDDPRRTEYVDRLLAERNSLRDAIRQHRDSSEGEPSAADRLLWSTLD